MYFEYLSSIGCEVGKNLFLYCTVLYCKAAALSE
jgi:hypothetical protein